MAHHVHTERPLDSLNHEHHSSDANRLAETRLLVGKLAHEMNNPLDSVLRYINLAIRLLDDQAADQPKEYLLRGRQGLLYMHSLIKTWLINAGQVQVEAGRLSLEHILDQAIHMCLAGQERQTVHIESHIPGTLPAFRPGILLQISINLISNAVDALHAKEKNRRLDITARQQQTMLLLRFCDNGCGLPRNELHRIFQPFFSTKPQGMGLGLAVCNDIVLKHHGRMEAQNRPGGGAIFTVHLPLEQLI